ncbi:hypothetical protein BBD40_28210 [Paenibacillus ihbetae]|uniref:Uncharacterized protein n=1 Tax=Paenibacillus ihbetae TaxID=1870820 RepID=A0ABX3JML2_9BACL|nr:hypothetical protein BBD40_28210 [Paenibacillus ihbetae]
MGFGDVIGRTGNIFSAWWHGVSFSIAVEFGKLELIIPDEIFRIQRRALRFPNAPQATYEGFPLSAKSIPISVEADAAEEGAAPVNRSGPWRRGMWVAEREMSFQPLLGMGGPSPSLLNSENWN